MMRSIAAVMIALVMWSVSAIDMLSAQVVDSSSIRVAIQPRRWVPARASQAQPLQRKISIDLSGVPLADALQRISQLARLKLGYSGDVRRSKVRVSLASDSLTVLDALLQVLDGTGFQPFVSLRGDAVLVSAGVLAPAPRSGRIVGRVTDAKNGEGILGAEVLLEATRWRTTTDSGGRYILAGIEVGAYTLVARRLGYAKRSQKITVRSEREDTVDFLLDPAAVPLNELITTATGPQRQRELGNAITTIRADSILQTQPIRSLTDLLEDRVPGLTVQHTSGAPGDPARLRLRGIGSVMRGNDPVVIVDGVRVYATQSDPRSGNLTNLGTAKARTCNGTDCGERLLSAGNVPAPSPLDQIDPNIIDKIEVFKGPSAATLYGADAANGVIVITTKKGRPGPTRWQVNATYARTATPGRWHEGYYRWGHIPERGGAIQFCAIANLACIPDSLVRFQALNDPALTVLGEGRRTGLSLTASGGTQTLTYSVTGSYGDEIGSLQLPAFEVEQFRTRMRAEPPDWLQRPHHLENWSVASNVTARLSSTADVSLRTTLARVNQQRSTLEAQISKVAGTYVDQVNGIYYRPGPIGSSVFPASVNYIPDYYQRTTASTITFTTGLSAQWRPRSWFNGSADVGINIIPRDDETLQPAGFVMPQDSGSLSRGTGRSLLSTFNMQGTVRKPLGLGFVFQASVGANLNTTIVNDVITSATGLKPGKTTIEGARTIAVEESRTNTSVFGWYVEPRIAGQRISFSTGLRLDGGSTYGTRLSQTGGSLLSLPKLNGSWVISEEPFFPFQSLFSSLRLRGAYGQAQVQPGPTDRLRIYNRWLIGAEPFLEIVGVGNTQLRPERSVEFEGGFDADLLDSRVSLGLTVYRKTQVDALMTVSLPLSVNGGGTFIQNIGNIRNQGIDLELRITPVQTALLTWSTELIYNRNTNTLVKLGQGVLPDKSRGWVEGYDISGRWARPILGYADANGNEVLERSEIQLGDSLVYMGRLYPGYTTSLHTNVALFGGAVGVTASFSYDAGATQIDQTARSNWILSQALIDPSTPLNEQAAVLAMDSTEYGMTQDVSTFRFTSLSVNYRAPTRVARLLLAQQITIGLQGSNLALNSTYRGNDPDVSSWTPGETIRDTGQLPLPRTWQLAISLRY